MRSVYVNEDWVEGKVYLLPEGKTSLGCVSWREEYGGIVLAKGERTALASVAEIKIDKSQPAKPLADVACVHRGDSTRTLEGCGCGTAPGVYACAIIGECIPFVGSGKKERAVRASGLAICEECSFRLPPAQ